MTRLRPEKEIKYAHFHMNLASISCAFFLMALFLAIYAIYYSVGVPTSWAENYSNKTLWIIENYSIYENGTKYYNYSNPDTYEFEYRLMGKWYDHLINGEYRYDFGSSFSNFCWNREIAPKEWLFSIYRASQLKANVQVLIRSAILITMTQHLLQLYVISKHRSMIFFPHRIFTVTAFVSINEFFYYISLFFVMNFQVWQDSEYIYMLPISVTMIVITFFLKLLLNTILSGNQMISLVRILFGITAVALSGNLFSSMNQFLQYMNCDQYTLPSVAIPEYIMISMIILNAIFDISNSKSMEFVITCEEEDLVIVLS